MSLLIDALKKAEQEKKEAAKRLKEAQEKSGEHIKLQSDEQVDLTASSSTASAEVLHEDSGISGPESDAEKKSISKLSLSPLDENTVEHKAGTELSRTNPGAEQKSTASLLLEDVTIDHGDYISPEDDGFENEDKAGVVSDKTFALTGLSADDDSAPPFDDTGDNTLKDKFANTLSDSRTYKSVVSAAELAKDIGGGRGAPTPVAAQTVFTAVGGSTGKRQIIEWSMFLGLFAAVILAAGTFYYLKVTPLTPEITSPVVAQGVEVDTTQPFIVPLPVEDLPAPEVISPADTPSTATVSETETETITDTTEAVPIAEQAVAEETVPEQIRTEKTVIEEAKVATIDTQDQPASVAENQVLPEKIQVDQSAIAISRTKSADKNDQLINTAYSEYSKGNYAIAEAAYQGVLKDMPENRDALLGMAAIAWRKGNLQSAYQYYLQVLRLYPKDAVAATGIISLQGYTDQVKNESMIKLMLRDQPDAAFLHFTLGNTYAAQSRWPEAQQSFFEAFRLQSGNPDYAYNLAVSLDQIGQARAAMEYYSKALELADKSEAGFNTANVLARVNDLSTNIRQD